MQPRPQASSSASKGSHVGTGTGQKSARGGKSGGQKARNQSSNADFRSLGGFQFTKENLAAFKEYQKQMEDKRQPAATSQDEGRLFLLSAIFDSHFFLSAIRRRNRMMVEDEEEGQSQNDDDEDLPPPAKRTRTCTLDDDELNIANDLRPFTSRPRSRVSNINDENGSQQGDEGGDANEQSDPGDADRDPDMDMIFGNENAEEEFGDDSVCFFLFT